MSEYHLAQINIARMRAPLDDPLLAGFVDQLEAINALADAAPGFVWRLQTDDGDATSIQAFDDPLILVNMSVWESVEDLYQFAYYSGHVDVFRQRRDWFERGGSAQVLWWIAAGHISTVTEARERLARLSEQGPTPAAFTFKQRFPAPVAVKP